MYLAASFPCDLNVGSFDKLVDAAFPQKKIALIIRLSPLAYEALMK